MYELETINAVNGAICRAMLNTMRPDGANATAYLEAEWEATSIVYRLDKRNGRNLWYREGRREAIKRVRDELCFLVEHKGACIHV